MVCVCVIDSERITEILLHELPILLKCTRVDVDALMRVRLCVLFMDENGTLLLFAAAPNCLQ